MQWQKLQTLKSWIITNLICLLLYCFCYPHFNLNTLMACLDCWWDIQFPSWLGIVAAGAVILARVRQWRLFQLQVDFGYLLKMNWSRSVAGFKRVKLLGSWFQASGWVYQAWQVSQFGCFLAEEQRTVGILLLITGDASCQHVSIKCSPVVIFCSFHFGVCWFTGVLTAGTCVISVSALSNDSWPYLLLSSHSLCKASLK